MGSSEQTASEAVIAAVAEREGVEETELPKPLYTVIDTESLDTLFRNDHGTCTFEYLAYTVTVDGTCTVEVSPIAEPSG